jgi:undecaprenyl-diphosphatase
VVIGTIPIAILGVIFEDEIQTVARNLWLIATTLVVFGLLLGLAERVGRQRTELHQIRPVDGVVLGFAQAMALVPGVSRSGGTITAGLFLGMTRPAIVRYSFLLAIPAVVASGIFQIPDVFAGDGPTPLQMTVATLIAFVLGYASIAWLLRYVERHSVYVFVWYRVLLGLGLFAALGTGALAAT